MSRIPPKYLHANFAPNRMPYQSKLGVSWYEFFQQCNFVLDLVFQSVCGSWKKQLITILYQQWLIVLLQHSLLSSNLLVDTKVGVSHAQYRKMHELEEYHSQDYQREFSWNPCTLCLDQGFLELLHLVSSNLNAITGVHIKYRLKEDNLV